MLPTTGFFNNIDCPFYETSCDRPYCHFKHRKKTHKKSAEGSAPQSAEVPTYKPTPKSQLANVRNHIPITYVPDLAIRTSDRSSNFRSSIASYRYSNKQPTYNPTPLSMLPTAKTTDTKLVEDKTQVPKYSPTSHQEDSNDINFDNLETEFNMIDELMSDSGTLDTTLEDGESTEEEKAKGDAKKNGTVKSKSKVQSNNKSNSRTDRKEKSSDKRNEKESERKKTQKDEKDKKKDKNDHHKNKHSSSKHSSNSSSSSSRHKHKSKAKEHDRKKNTSDKHKEENRHSSKDKKHKEKEHKKSKSEKETSRKNTPSSNHKDVMHNLNDDDVKDCDISDGVEDDQNFSGEDDSDMDDDPIKECYKIFTEYKPTEPNIFDEIPEQVNNENSNNQEETFVSSNNKKRIAHINADKLKSAIAVSKLKITQNPARTMVNRLKAARLAQADNEHQNIFAEIERMKRPATEIPASASNPAKVPKLISKPVTKPSTSSFSLIDDIISGKSLNTKPRRIAPVQNVCSIQRAKAKIDEMAKIRAMNAMNKTASQTLSKGAKRVAHMPEHSVADIPDVLEVERSKLPVNVRSRYLKMIVDECLKLYLSKDEAYQRALNEEFKCYERCSVLVTYRNTAMLAINRIRKELQERELSGLGPIFPGETSSTDKSSGSELKGQKLYKNIKRYVLSEEELVLHGFPREGTTPGHAIIKLQKKLTKTNLEKNDRICSRCLKHYKVDKNGFALYDEECLYHPLKKRTFRGESIYLCCKSGEGTGCVTSNTHVCDRINPNDDQVEGFQTIMPPELDDDPRSYEVFALDCEMCYTTKGLELTRVTIVNSECKTVYETLVKPLNPIIDYNTRFSGITEEQMERTATSILQVQANILHLCNSETILIGHSLESDMKALKIIHSNVMDTSVLFPHKFGLPHKRALRDLAREYLKKIIQNDVSGHDSAEDALTCMELVQWKIREEFKARGIKV